MTAINVKAKNIEPLSNRVVIKPDEKEEATPGGIVLPDEAKKDTYQGTVVAAGPGRVLDNGQTLPNSVKEGDRVLYSSWGGTEIELDGQSLIVLAESDIIGKIA